MATEMAGYNVENGSGCGFMGGIFNCKSYWLKKSSVHSLPSNATTKNDFKSPQINDDFSSNSVEFKIKSTDGAIVLSSNSCAPSSNPDTKKPRKASFAHQQPRRHSDAARSSVSSTNGAKSQHQDMCKDTKLRRASTIPSAELSGKISDHHKANESTKALVPATSNGIIFSGQRGNLRQHKHSNSSPNRKNNGYGNVVGNNGVIMRNVVKKNSDDCNKLDPEVLKLMGNEAYKQGKFEEALSLYDRAISLDSNKAAYHGNKGAALIRLGRLIDAVYECKEAIQIEPSYHKAHHRLATTYLRLGKAEKALDHFKQSGLYANSKDIDECQALQKCISRCTEAQKLEEWNVLLSETQLAISSGANSSPQVFALQAEALLKLVRHEEAYATFQERPGFSIELCTKFFGLANSAYLSMIGAQVYLAAGRFHDAVAAAQNAARLSPSDNAVAAVVKRARAVASARVSGNLLFKASKYSEACVVYSKGLEHDPHSSVLLCNRAACRSKLGQYEKAIEDCNAALHLRPSYSKALLRRADCNAKLERWGASIQDYEVLIRETPGDEEVGKALFEAKIELKRQHGEDIKDENFGSNLVLITSSERFRHLVTSPGMSVVLFCSKTKQKQVLQALQQVCKRFPSVHFLKVEVEDHPYLANMEDVSTIPAFKIYKNGSRVKEIPGNKHELLESSVKLYSS